MNKVTILTLAISVSGISQTYASLPDEINYSPYENQYQVLAANVDQITAELNRAEDDLAQAYKDEQLITQGIVDYEDANQDVRDQILNATNDLANLRINRRDLTDIIFQLGRRLNTLTRNERQLLRQIENENSRIEPLRLKLQNANQRLKRSRVEVEVAEGSVSQARGAVSSIQNGLANLRNQQKSLQTQLQNQKTQLASIDLQISAVNNELSRLPSKISVANSELNFANQELKTLSGELATQRTELTDILRTNPNDPRVRELRSELSAKARVVAAQRQVVTQKETALQLLKKEEGNLQQNITNLENQKRSLPAAISRTESAIRNNQNQINSKKSDLNHAISNLSSEEARFKTAVASYSRLENQVSQLRSDIERESRSLNRLIAERNEISAQLDDIVNRTNTRERELAQTEKDIRSLESYLPELESSLRSNQLQITKLQNDLRVVQDDIVASNRSVNELTREQSVEISKRDSKYEQYISRYNFYNKNLDDARELGSTQTGPANELAIDASNNYVVERSNFLGNSMGEAQAQVEANFWGSVRAELQGHRDGYSLGLISEPDIERGQNEGLAAGIEQVNNYADQVLKPQFFNQFFNENISNERSGVAALNISKNVVGLSKKFKVFEFSNTVEPLSPNELESSLLLNTPLDEVVSLFSNNYNQTIAEVEQLSIPANAFEAPKSLPFGTPNCSSVYKSVSEFMAACKQSYKLKFEDTYRTVFYQNFESQYLELYSNTLENKRDSLIESLYDVSFSKHYITAKNAGLEDGKKDIYEQTFANAKEKAYAENLPGATNRVKAEAQSEVKDWINLNPTLTLAESKIEGKKLRGNTKAKLVLSVKNISPKDLSRPVKVVITDIENATISQREFYLKEAPGNKTSEFREIEFMIASSARSNEEIKISGELVLSGGKYEVHRSENFVATAMTAVNPAISTNLQYDSTPQVVSTFRRRTLIHNFDTSISPSVESVSKGYVVSLKAAPGYAGMINLKNTSFRIGSINYGLSQNIRFQYTFPRSSEKKLVKIIATYTYDGEVVKTDLIDLRPH